MKTYILLDLSNLFYRSRHVVRGDMSTKIGMALHITLSSIFKVWREFNADHLVICLEGRSWRKDHYAPYKLNRKETRDALSDKDKEEDQAFWEVYNEFTAFLTDQTNCSVLQHSRLEADDLIAGWIQHHPNDQHIIVSTDGDFVQLVNHNVKIYNGVANVLITDQGYFDEKGNHVIDKKTKQKKPAPDPQWALFEKCMRGDTSDNIFSAYPGVRTKGTKNKIGLLDAYNDKTNKGFIWNNFMLQRWTDHNGIEHRVLDDYNRNVLLCDLTSQPEEIKECINNTINNVETKTISQVGVRLMKFCSKWDLQKIADQAQSISVCLNSAYN